VSAAAEFIDIEIRGTDVYDLVEKVVR